MIRLLLIVAIASLICRLIANRWPWEFMKAPSTRQRAILRARTLLGTEARASREEIIEAHKRLIALVHPDRGGNNDQVHEANAARDLLLEETPMKKAPIK